MITIKDIQAQISEGIKSSGYTQTEIGKKLGISQQTVSHYIKGDKMPSLDTLANLCVLLDLDPAEVLCVNKSKNI
ncbi:MAG: helix-turn-helix transcriptional regulator [Christensenellaceae bacterium]